MKTKRLFTLALAGLMAVSLASSLWAKPPKMKMTTDIPPGIATPDKVETRIGTLTSFDGVPDKETVQKVYDNLDFQRATQAYLNSIQIASMNGMREGILKWGPANYTAPLFEGLMDSKTLFLTPNSTSIYQLLWLDLTDGPMVMETPPNVIGLVDDAWFHYVADFGQVGPDKNKGGKFLFLPPGYKGDIPDGYFVEKSQTYGNWVIWRSAQVNGSTASAINATKEKLRVYPLAKKDNPPKMTFINVSGKPYNTIHSMDARFFEEVNAVVQREPTEGQDPEILGQLASIGIKKGQPFKPDARIQKIFSEAADVAAVTVRALVSRPREDAFYYYPGKGVWTTPFIGGSYLFLDKNNSRYLDARAFFHFYATDITPAMTQAPYGKGSIYAVAYMDHKGEPLDGGKIYKVHVPPNVPGKSFWSFTLYDNQTRAELQTDQQFPGIDSNKKGLVKNADGSYDISTAPPRRRARRPNGSRPFPARAGTCCGVSMVRSSPGMTGAGRLVILRW
jgi:hypothetical protein